MVHKTIIGAEVIEDDD